MRELERVKPEPSLERVKLKHYDSVSRGRGLPLPAGAVAQLGERWLCKPEVTGSIPVSSTVR